MGKKGKKKAKYFSVGKIGHSMQVGSSRHKLLRQVDAWIKGKNVILRELDVDKWHINKESLRKTEEENAPLHEHLIKVNALEVWGSPYSKN